MGFTDLNTRSSLQSAALDVPKMCLLNSYINIFLQKSVAEYAKVKLERASTLLTSIIPLNSFNFFKLSEINAWSYGN